MEIKIDELKKAYKVTAIIGIVIIASIFVYALVVEIIKRTNAPFSGFSPFPQVDSLRYVFLLITIAEYFLIRFVRDKILSAKINLAQTGQSSPFLGRLTTSAIITFALCESVTIYGLVLFLIAGNTTDFYAFMAISLIYFGIYFPRYSQWEEWVKGLGITRM